MPLETTSPQNAIPTEEITLLGLREFLYGIILSAPILLLAMAPMFGLSVEAWIDPHINQFLQLILTSLVIVTCGRSIVSRGIRSIATSNLNMFTLLFWSHPTMSTVPILGSQGSWSIAEYLGSYDIGQTQATDGFAWYASMVNGVGDWLLPLLNQSPDPYGHSLWQVVLHVITYVTVMTLGSMMFAKFWIETTNMGPKDVAKQIENTGMQIPGFRKNPKVLERILMRYIPPVTLFSGAFVGLLAAGADLLGTVGNATGTGLLLAVGIILRTYEQIQKEPAMEMHPVLREFFGAE